MGGKEELIKVFIDFLYICIQVVTDIDNKIGNRELAEVPQSTLVTVKNQLKFQLTEDCVVPFETSRAQQLLMRVTKVRNRRTG